MRNTITVITALVAASCTAVSALPQQPSANLTTAASSPGVAKGCEALSASLRQRIFLPGTDVYKYENTQLWSNTQLKRPGCVFRPVSAQEMGTAVKTLAAKKAPFAVRGGGHMGVPGANNIDDPGVMIVLSNLTNIALNKDKSILTLAPGFGRWAHVYHWLEPHNLAVAGGRLGPVGVPGLLLAGGINFHGNQVGFSSDTVVSYQVVVGDGSIITATAKQNSDLFWALKGGSSNFGIVTEFQMKTIPSKRVWAGTLAVAQKDIGALYAAVAKYSEGPSDPKSHLIPAVAPPTKKGDPSIAVAIMLYDSETESRPKCFEPFFKLTNISDSTGFKTVAQFADENGAAVIDHINDVFVAGTFAGKTQQELLKGIQATNDTFYAALEDLYKNIPTEDIVTLQLDWQPISKTWIEAGIKSNPAGSPLLGGFPEYKTKTYLAYAQVVEWKNDHGNHDAFVAKWIETTTKAINENLGRLYVPFNYMGDAAGFQNIYDGYGPANKEKLLQISRKYDQQRVFQKLMPGGFKLEKLP